jgi:tetratricopeptide (TPR) repeat protein
MLFATVSLAVVPSVCAQQPDPDDTALQVTAAMDGGVAAFKGGRYADAAASFAIATRLAPNYEPAHLYLGTAYAIQFVPTLTTPENKQLALSALEEFDAVLRLNPGNLSALKQAASMDRSIQRYDDALAMEKKAVEIDPNDVDTIYSLGYIEWEKANKSATAILAEDGVSDDGHGNPKLLPHACKALKAANTDLVNDGIANFQHVIQLKPDNADAMQYLQLMYRRHADFACGDKVGIAADLKLAEQWEQKAAETRSRAGAKPQ